MATRRKTRAKVSKALASTAGAADARRRNPLRGAAKASRAAGAPRARKMGLAKTLGDSARRKTKGREVVTGIRVTGRNFRGEPTTKTTRGIRASRFPGRGDSTGTRAAMGKRGRGSES